MNESQKYLFDTFGYVRIPNVLSKEEVLSMNAAIDRRSHDFFERTGAVRNSQSGVSGRRDCGNFLTWPVADAGDMLRSLICRPELVPILDEVCGVGFRMDHSPVLFAQQSGAEGFDFHGGAVKSDGSLNFPIAYRCDNGRIFCSLVNAAVQLTDSPPGSGGFVVVPGSHKSNFHHPADLSAYGVEPPCDAGDVILFTEAVLHGATVRLAAGERRVVLMRFAPATCAYARGYIESSLSITHPGLLTPAQASVLTPPYHADQDRLIPTDNDAQIPHPRANAKKEFDRIVFGSDYY